MFENLKKFSPDGSNGGGDPTPETCTHDCGSCPSGGSCGSFDPASLLEESNPYSNIGKVIAVVSGKGGVGKSLITSLLAKEVNSKGFDVAILDADITGPSIPKSFGVSDRILAD